jgi:hypothetical protein
MSKGTPTLLRVELWGQLLDALQRNFNMSKMLSGEGEFTVEVRTCANPTEKLI